MTYLPRVVMASMWQNETAPNRRLVDRVEHLLAKSETYPALRWVWVVGDSTDDTMQALWQLSRGYDVFITRVETGIEGDDARSRLRRLSETANEYFNWCDNADYILIHESDIASPSNIVNRLVAHAERGLCPVAAWPTLEIRPGHKMLYDVWALRKDGVRFKHHPPYHPGYKRDEVFEVDSAGTVMLFDTRDAKYIHMVDGGFLDLCQQLKEQGRSIYVDPALEVCQPFDLWQYRQITKEYA